MRGKPDPSCVETPLQRTLACPTFCSDGASKQGPARMPNGRHGRRHAAHFFATLASGLLGPCCLLITRRISSLRPLRTRTARPERSKLPRRVPALLPCAGFMWHTCMAAQRLLGRCRRLRSRGAARLPRALAPCALQQAGAGPGMVLHPIGCHARAARSCRHATGSPAPPRLCRRRRLLTALHLCPNAEARP